MWVWNVEWDGHGRVECNDGARDEGCNNVLGSPECGKNTSRN